MFGADDVSAPRIFEPKSLDDSATRQINILPGNQFRGPKRAVPLDDGGAIYVLAAFGREHVPFDVLNGSDCVFGHAVQNTALAFR